MAPLLEMTPEKARTRDLYLRRRFRITLRDYDAVLARQGGGCAICGRPPGTMSLAVDHDHKSGTVRGLLCSYCNRGLRYYRDKPALFDRAADYLRLPPAVAVLGEIVAPNQKRKRRRRRRG